MNITNFIQDRNMFTTMRVISFFIIIYSLDNQITAGSCYLQAQDGSPTDSECNLAAPNITFTSTHTELNIEQDVLQDGDKAWVGYAREAVILQYIGCISAEDIREENINFLEFPTVLNLGICFHICYQNGLAVVGIQGNTENRCKCFSLRIMSYEAKETDCNVKCSNNKFWCGGQTHISLYEQVVGGVIAKELYSQPDKCLATSKGTYIYNWRSCDDRLWSYCIGGRKDKTQMSPYKTDVWSGSIKHCFNEDWYPMVYRERPPLSRWSEYWMGVIKTTTVEALYNWPGEGEAMLGYVERTGDIYSLKFTDNKNDVNMSICLKADTSTTRSSTVPTTTPSTEEDRTELVPDTSRSANTAGIDQMPLANSKQDEGSIKVAFYIGVPAVILVIVVVVIVVCLKRRKRKNRLDKPAASNQHVRGAAYTNHHEGVPLQCDNEEDVYSEIHEEVDGAQYQDRNIEYGNNAEINAAMYDVYEAPDDKSTDKSLKVEVFDNQYQVPDDEDDVYEEPDKDTQTVRYNDAKHDIYYDAADEDYGTKSKASGDTEHDNNYQSKNSARIKTNVGSYFILEKEKPPIDSADNQVHIPMVQSGRAYNHVQLPNRADGQTDEYDHIGNVPGPRASRKDYNTTLVDTSNTYDTSTTVKVLPGATTTDNTYSKSVRRQ